MWSQGQPISNRHWFPCFDHPNERQTTEIIVTVDARFQASSNGRLMDRTRDDTHGTATFHWLQDTPHAAYLVSLVVGDFHIEHDQWQTVPLEYWVHPQYVDQVPGSFGKTPRMLAFFSDFIGVPYPWARYAQLSCHGFGGGMENTSATTLGTRMMHDDRSLVDGDSDGLLAHELAHQWFGDYLTCNEWAHLWLNEGFATYFEALWEEHDSGRDDFAYNMLHKMDRALRGGRARPIVDVDYPSPGSMFDARAYPKGAWVLHMLRRHLGDDLFRATIKQYVTDHALGTVETSDLRKTISRTTGRSMGRFFYDWTTRPGHPEVTVTSAWSSEDSQARVTVRQTQEAEPFHFDLELVFAGADPNSGLHRRVHVDKREVELRVHLSAPPARITVDPNFAVLLDLSEKKGHDLWKAQLLDAPEVISRIRAVRHFGDSKKPRDRKLLASALANDSFWGVRVESATALGNSGGDEARDALIQGLTDNHARVRRACAAALGGWPHDPDVTAALRRFIDQGDPGYRAEVAAIESLGQVAPDTALPLLIEVLKRDSRNETLRSAALAAMAHVRDLDVLDILIRWAQPQAPRKARPAALRSLAQVTRHLALSTDQTRTVVVTLETALTDSDRSVRRAAARALAELADLSTARSALPRLDAMAANDADRRARGAARRAAEFIRKGQPAPVQLDDLREQIDELKDQKDELIERIERLEATGVSP